MENRKECGNCALYNHEQQGCVRTQRHQKPSDSCSSFATEIPTCEICGQMFIPPTVYVMEGEYVIRACSTCASALSTCQTCAHGKSCDFQTNPVNLPPMVQKEVRQGNMFISTTVPNPERVKVTCMANCRCWDETDSACNKQCGTCGGYKPSYLP